MKHLVSNVRKGSTSSAPVCERGWGPRTDMMIQKREKLEVVEHNLQISRASVSHLHQIHKSEAGNTRLHFIKSRSTCTEVAVFVPLTTELAG